MEHKNFFYAVSVLIGTIVGVGIFAIPYVCAQAGMLVGFLYFILIGGAILLLHLFYGEIILRTEGEHRLAGYAEKYLGGWGKKIVGAIIIFEFYGAMLAYLIVGGGFLSTIFNKLLGGSDFLWALIFFALGSLAILFGMRLIGAIEVFMTFFLLVIIGVLFFKGLPHINFGNLTKINLTNFFLPYGIILFSLTGGAAIPEMRQILKGEEKKLKKAIIWGTTIAVFASFLFGFSIVGITGSLTTQTGIEGLVPFLGDWILMLGAFFGFLAVATSFLIIGLNLRNVFWRDYKINKILAWLLACFVPLVAYLLGLINFIVIIGLVGAIAGGLEGISMILIYRQAKSRGERASEYSLKVSPLFIFGLIFLFALGIIYQFVYLAKW